MGQFDDETAVQRAGDRFTTRLSAAWGIGANPNGGYAVQPVLRALGVAAARPDPVSVTVHYLRPALGDAEGEIVTEVVRSGRRATHAAGRLLQDGQPRLTVAAVLCDLATPSSAAPDDGLTVPPPDIPPPVGCVDRAELDQGIAVPLLSRVDVRVRRDGASPGAVVEGWVRLRDGTAPTAAALVLFADAFPPAVHAVMARVGWVPTLELTVHVRRRPSAGWVQARIECDDVADGWMVETGSLWDETGALVARSRQLGLVTHPG
ncbi:MAG TPA: thioesterase family protein [Ilumatobacteraceae bacterium]|nr:thioesterase family protein [Ilumatobacteraceae bacterium]